MNAQDRALMQAQFSANRYMDPRVACTPKPKIHNKPSALKPEVRSRTFSSDSSASEASSTASTKSSASSVFGRMFHKHKATRPQHHVHWA